MTDSLICGRALTAKGDAQTPRCHKSKCDINRSHEGNHA
jgi:hypothetical protein